MQGSWLTQRFYTYKCNNSPCSEDAVGQIDSYELLGDELGTCKWNCKTEKLNNKTMYLLGLYTLNNEHLLVAKMIQLTYTIQPPISMHGIIVDSILIKGPNKSIQKMKESSPLSYCGDRRLGGVRPPGPPTGKSASFRSCVRARGLVVRWKWRSTSVARIFPFPFCGAQAFPFPFRCHSEFK